MLWKVHRCRNCSRTWLACPKSCKNSMQKSAQPAPKPPLRMNVLLAPVPPRGSPQRPKKVTGIWREGTGRDQGQNTRENTGEAGGT